MSEIRNLHPDPRCLQKRSIWGSISISANGEKWRYELSGGSSNGTVFCWNGITNQDMSGKVLYVRVQGAQSLLDNLSIEQANLLTSENGWIAAKVPDDNVGNHTVALHRGPFTLCEVGAYTPEDWEKLYAIYQKGTIAYPWVAGPRAATMAGEKGPWEL